MATAPSPAAFDEVGDPDGFPVAFHHGTPCSRLLPRWWDAPARERGLRVVCFDRPGYGNAPARPERTIQDVVNATAAAMSALGADRFAAWGGSGGCSYALGCAALLPDRVSCVVSVAGNPPFDETLDGEGWDAEELEFSRRHVADPTAASRETVRRRWVEPQADPVRRFDVAGWLDAWQGGFTPADRDALGDGETGEYLLGNVQEALRPGVDGWMDDGFCALCPWGFKLEEIHKPVAIWHSDDDRMVPIGSAHRLAASIPNARLFEVSGHGHPALILRHIEPVMDWIVAQVTASAQT